MAVLTGVMWYLTVVLICISLMASVAEHPFICLGPSVCPLWRSICSGPLPVFLISICISKNTYFLVLTSILTNIKIVTQVFYVVVCMIYLFLFFNFNFVLLFNYSCVPFLPIPPTPAEPPSLSHLHTPPWFCPCVLYSSSCNTCLLYTSDAADE